MNKIFLIALISLSSCTYLIKQIDQGPIVQNNAPQSLNSTPTYCALEEKFQYQAVNTNEHSQDYFISFIKSRPELDFLDQFALWTLLQQTVRPDQSSPTSRLQLVMKTKSSQYFDFYSEENNNQYPVLYGVEWLLKKFKKNTRLETYAKILDEHFSNQLKVGKQFEAFLLKNKAELLTHPILGPYFIRGSEPLQEDERLPSLSYKTLISLYRKHEKNQKITVNVSLTQFETQNGNSGLCNYDFNLYENSIFLIDKVIPQGNIFGFSNHQNAFFASTSQKVMALEPVDSLPLFKGQSKIRSTGICILKTQNGDVWTLSNNSRDPGQHLFHLIKYGLMSASNASDVDKLLRHSRHIFLNDPLRLVIESSRSREDQIENLLKLNIPIYNADYLGNVWALSNLNKQYRFIIDDRNPGALSCK